MKLWTALFVMQVVLVLASIAHSTLLMLRRHFVSRMEALRRRYDVVYFELVRLGMNPNVMLNRPAAIAYARDMQAELAALRSEMDIVFRRYERLP